MYLLSYNYLFSLLLVSLIVKHLNKIKNKERKYRNQNIIYHSDVNTNNIYKFTLHTFSMDIHIYHIIIIYFMNIILFVDFKDFLFFELSPKLLSKLTISHETFHSLCRLLSYKIRKFWSFFYYVECHYIYCFLPFCLQPHFLEISLNQLM